jgi:hypothetical protein
MPIELDWPLVVCLIMFGLGLGGAWERRRVDRGD